MMGDQPCHPFVSAGAHVPGTVELVSAGDAQRRGVADVVEICGGDEDVAVRLAEGCADPASTGSDGEDVREPVG